MLKTSSALSRIILVSFIGLLLALHASAAPNTKEIDASVARAKKWLFDHQVDGKWEPAAGADKSGEYATGQTALVVRALLAAGEQPEDERIAKAIAFLKATPCKGVFSLGVRLQLWQMLPITPEIKGLIHADADALVEGGTDPTKLTKKGSPTSPPRNPSRNSDPGKAAKPVVGRGFYGSLVDSKTYNLRSSYYANLGLWCAEQSGCYEVGQDFWIKTEKAWRDEQDAGGGFSYRGKTSKDAVTPGTTANGIATLFITQDFLHNSEAITPRGNIPNKQIDSAMAWLTSNWSKIEKDVHYRYDFPYSTLYAVEEVGVASGFKYFEDIDWYQSGAEKLLRLQSADGSWPGDYPDQQVLGTAFGLLFLTQGRAPVVINKLQYSIDGVDGNWNQRPRDAANIVRWIEKQTERDLNWQIVNLKAPLADLHEAPILYICGNQELKFTADEKKKLRDFAEGGGLILGNADASADAFTDSFKKLVSELFPDFEFRELPASHPIYTNEQFRADKWKKKPTVLGVSNGARELAMLLPDVDLARAWQMQETSAKSETFELMADLFAYCTDKKDALVKGATFIVTPDPTTKPTSTITVTRLKYPGDWNPEPAGWPRLAAILNNEDRVELKVNTVDIAKDSIGSATIAHLTGTGKIKLSQTARSAIKSFVDGGGTLLVDAAGGNLEFAQSVEPELSAIFGADAAKQLKSPLAASNPLFNGNGHKLEVFGYRSFARQQAGSELKGPRLRGITIKGRLAVIYSPEDLSVGLIGAPVDGINGYDPKTATEIVRNVLLNSAKSGGSATTQPAKPVRATPKPATKPATN